MKTGQANKDEVVRWPATEAAPSCRWRVYTKFGIGEPDEVAHGGYPRHYTKVGSFSPAYYDWLADRVLSATRMLRESVAVDPFVRSGVPVLRGTRFTVSQLLGELADGRSVGELAEDFDLDLEQIKEFLYGLAIHMDRPVLR